jgi:hypothetical protein
MKLTGILLAFLWKRREMMEEHERKIFEELKAHVNCSKNFACVNSAIEDLCDAKYYPDIDLLECLENEPQNCELAKPYAARFICTCLLREYIVKNFDKWIVDSANRIKRMNLCRF